MAPLGALSSNALGQSGSDLSVYFNSIMAIVIGIFLHISTTILFESSEQHRFNYLKFFVIVIGAGLAFLPDWRNKGNYFRSNQIHSFSFESARRNVLSYCNFH